MPPGLAAVIVAALLASGVQNRVVPDHVGPGSMYRPGDGFNSGRLACGGRFTEEQNHIAYRRWCYMGCGRPVLVCSYHTKRCIMSKVWDGGPYGSITGPVRHAKREGRWRRCVNCKMPVGWRYRGITDLSVGAWRLLGRPRFLSPIHLFFLPRTERRWCNATYRRPS
jgi:hypothetical protein